MTSFQLVVNWLTGDYQNNVPVLRLLKPVDVKHLGCGTSVQLRQMKVFMKEVQKVASENNLWTQLITHASVNQMWEKVGPILFLKYGKPSQRRNTEFTWKTMYNQISSKKASAAGGVSIMN